MRLFTILTAIMATGLIAACSPEGKYPGTGEDCSADDPVKSLDISDCVPPT